MSRAVAVLVVCLLVGGAIGPVVATGAQESTPSTESVTIAPGPQLTGVVGVQEAEVEGTVRERAFDIAFSEAASNDSKAAVVASTARRLAERLDRLERRKSALRSARANGSLSDDEFRARMAILGSEIATVRRLANRTATADRTLPSAAVQAAGLGREAIPSIRRRAANLSTPEMNAIARSVAGNRAGRPVGNATGPRGPNPAGRNVSRATGSPGQQDGGPGAESRSTGGTNRNQDAGESNRSGDGGRDTSETDRSGNGSGDAGQSGAGYSWDGTSLSAAGSTQTAGARLLAAEATVGDGSHAAVNRRSEQPRARSGDRLGVGVQASQDEPKPLFAVDVGDDGDARVTLQLAFDLTTDADLDAFRTLQDDESAQADVSTRFRDRLRSIANASEERVDRSMTVRAPAINLTTSEDGTTGFVAISVEWDGLAGLASEPTHLVLTEPFASGFTPSRQFTVRITAPDRFRVTSITPEPGLQANASATWPAGTNLNGFKLVFSPGTATPLPTDVVDQFDPSSPTEGSSDGTGPSTSALIVGGALVVASGLGGWLFWRRRQAENAAANDAE